MQHTIYENRNKTRKDLENKNKREAFELGLKEAITNLPQYVIMFIFCALLIIVRHYFP